MKIFAVIPARGGSERIPRKNIRPFAGRPVIAYPIAAAHDAALFTRILVSTDSPEIAAVAEELGAEAPFIRPAHLSGAETPTAPVIEHALQWLLERGEEPAYCCCIYPATPLLRAEDLRLGLDTLRRSGASSVVSVAAFPSRIQRALTVDAEGRLAMRWPEHELVRSQLLEESYFDAGQFYWLDARRFLADPRILTPDSRAVVIPRERAVDIDTLDDWALAESIYKGLRQADDSGTPE